LTRIGSSTAVCSVTFILQVHVANPILLAWNRFQTAG
jgi:hypothetical protein